MEEAKPLKSMWKVPFRQVYCDTFKDCLKTTFWCLVVIKVFPHAFNFEGDAMLDEYIKDPELFHDHHKFLLLDAKRARDGLARNTETPG